MRLSEGGNFPIQSSSWHTSITLCEEPNAAANFAMPVSSNYAAASVAPNLARGLHHQFQLRDLFFDGDLVAFERRGKSALRAERQLLQRQHDLDVGEAGEELRASEPDAIELSLFLVT